MVIVVHVMLVWRVRYEWQLAEAVRNGYLGFGVFHAALAMIVASLFVARARARVLVFTAFAIVTLGALGAVSRYEVVAHYRIPVIFTAVVGAVALLRGSHRSRRLTAA
jgi:hypothetical protein